MARFRILALSLALALALVALPLPAVSPPALHGSGGAVATDEPLATAVGVELLKQGGNAVDAAVGTALALAVTYPEAGNLGGGGFALVRTAGGELAALDFREVGPAGAQARMYLDEHGEPIPKASLRGPLATGVPGSPAGLYELHHRFGRLAWKSVVEPARKLAAEGYRVSFHLAGYLVEERAQIEPFAESARVFLPGGKPLEHGALLRQPELAATLAAYAARGPKAIQEGPLAQQVEEASRRYGGILTAADLAAYQPQWRKPLEFSFGSWQAASMPLPSAGGLILALTEEILRRIERDGPGPRFGAERDHALTEAMKRSYAVRYLLGDPATSLLDPGQALAAPYVGRLALSFDRERATPAAELAQGEPGREPNATTHLSVIDAEGNMVALTTTLNGLFGCGLYVPGLGFLNNEMDDFTTAPGRPNDFGLIQGDANAVRPGKRMLSSMTPTIAWSGPEALVLGGRGGSRISSAVLQVLLDVIQDGDPLQAALDRPRLHHQWQPDVLEVEDAALSPETARELERRGHRIVPSKPQEKSRVNAVRRLADGTLEAAVDPRGTGEAGVVTELAPR